MTWCFRKAAIFHLIFLKHFSCLKRNVPVSVNSKIVKLQAQTKYRSWFWMLFLIIFCHIWPIMNISVSTGKFLTFLEIATVLSIHEEDNPKDMVNYRLIAILNVFSKIDEKNFYNLMVAFLDKHNLLSDCQHLPKMLLSSYWKNSSSLLMVAGTWYI